MINQALLNALSPAITNTSMTLPALDIMYQGRELLHLSGMHAVNFDVFLSDPKNFEHHQTLAAYKAIMWNRASVIVIDQITTTAIEINSLIVSHFAAELLVIIIKSHAHARFIYTLQQSVSYYSYVHIIIEEDAAVDFHGLYINADWMKQAVTIDIKGSRSHARITGLVITRENQQAFIETQQYHYASDSQSSVLIKTIAHDASKFMYSGMIHVGEHAHGTHAQQYNKNILCSPQAAAWSQPGLEVKTNQVKCAHGSATGPFAQEILWYGASRGIGNEPMKKILLETFVSNVLRKEHRKLIEKI